MSKRVEEQKEKVMTKYDRKMEARREAAIQDAKEKRMIKIGVIAIVAALVIAVIGSIAYSVYEDKAAVSKAYVKVGDMEFTRQDYDFFYALTVDEFATNYSDLLSFMGIDFSVSFDQQQYTEDYTWDDQFDTMTVSTLQNIAVLYQDAKENGFEYDATAELEEFSAEIESNIEEYSYTRETYYKACYGEYADETVVYELQEMYIYAFAYQDYLKTVEVVDAADIEATYNAAPDVYDVIDYYSYSSIIETATDATDAEAEEALAESLATAEEFLERFNAGESFADLSVELSSETYASLYEEHGGFFEGVSSGAVLEHSYDWLFEEEREAGDQTILFNDSAENYNVLVFSDRYKPDTADETIQTELIDERVSAYVADLIAGAAFEDVSANLNLIES
ncbi:MAG: hypothetical protein R3Y47_03780 [Lachnospiraceae bacterium]